MRKAEEPTLEGLKDRHDLLTRHLSQLEFEWKKRFRYKEGHRLNMKDAIVNTRRQLNRLTAKIEEMESSKDDD